MVVPRFRPMSKTKTVKKDPRPESTCQKKTKITMSKKYGIITVPVHVKH